LVTDHGDDFRVGVLFVCTANICRSPTAELILRRHLVTLGITDIAVSSAGVEAVDGDPIDTTMSSLLLADGLDASGFSAHRLDDADIATADLVLTATKEHRRLVVQRVPKALRKTYTILEFAGLAEHLVADGSAPGMQRLLWLRDEAAAQRNLTLPLDMALDIADPYRRRRGTYRSVHKEIQKALDSLVTALVAPASLSE
jgi:protein-tyrosine phosphatase